MGPLISHLILTGPAPMPAAGGAGMNIPAVPHFSHSEVGHFREGEWYSLLQNDLTVLTGAHPCCSVGRYQLEHSMANYVTHRVIVTGPEVEIRRFRDKVIRPSKDDGLDCFDFETLVPMPESVRNTTSCTDSELGIEILTGKRKPSLVSPGAEQSFLTFEWIREEGIHTIEQLRQYAEREFPKALEEGRKALAAYQETGFYDWDDWSETNWGTSCPAYHFWWVSQTPDRLEFLFDTKWDVPRRIFDKLASEFPALIIEVACFDEGWRFAGRGILAKGRCVISIGKATADLYEYVYGRTPEEDEEDDESLGDQVSTCAGNEPLVGLLPQPEFHEEVAHVVKQIDKILPHQLKPL